MKKKKVKRTKKVKKKIPFKGHTKGNEFTIPRYIMPTNKHPICPTFITDPSIGSIVAIVGIVSCVIILWRIMIYYGR